MFTPEQRDYVRDRLLGLARTDPRVTGGALAGSPAVGAEDEWSDIALASGIADDISPAAVLQDWTALLGREFGALHHWDMHAGATLYRVFLLPEGREVDMGVASQQDFGARGARFRPLMSGVWRPVSPGRGCRSGSDRYAE